MIKDERLREAIGKTEAANLTNDLVPRIVQIIDLTSLNETDTEASINSLCKKAITPKGLVAAVCVYPAFVDCAKKALQGTKVKVATVANFPSGDQSLREVLVTIHQAIATGVDEIDVVFPYHSYLQGKVDYAKQFIHQCKMACGQDILLKVILETGVFHDRTLLVSAARDALMSGADFIKTSTGKITQGATLEAAAILLFVLKDMHNSKGIKISGGIRDWRTAARYLLLADEIMGKQWLSPQTFRLGVSRLVDDIPDSLY